ncbi:toprim domain-containing protein [Fluviispira vulneris]|uniref:toprim domain-containing protein n=1 Tax=Fluviispira vulneris TaxID=2763012 RepID=UPI0016454FA2|nr:toprim domain-containing protein [Fluviispira vulneris]
MRLRKQSIQNIIDTVNLPDHLKRYLEVKRSGSHSVAKCPFHQDTSPSLCIYTDNYHCFACKAHGNLIDYEMHRTGASFREAVQSLAEMYQLPLEYESPSDQDPKSHLSAAFFEKQNKNLMDMEAFFKENLLLLLKNAEKENSAFYLFLIDQRKFDYGYSGSAQACHDFFSKREFGNYKPFDLSERLVFPIYKDSGKITGFLFSKKIAIESIKTEEDCLQLFTDLEQYTPYPKSFLPVMNWQNARSHAAKAKQLFVVTNLVDFLFLAQRNIANTVVCIGEKLDLNLTKIFAKRVPVVTLVLEDSKACNSFLWKTFVDNIHLEDITLQILKFPKTAGGLRNFLTNYDDNGLQKWLSQIKFVINEVTEKVIYAEHVSESQKIEEFKKFIIPVLNKIEDFERKNRILDNLSRIYFGSAKEILFQAQSRNKYDLNFKKENKEINYLKKEEKSKDQLSIKSVEKVDVIPENNLNKIASEKDFLHKTILFYHKILMSEKGKEAQVYLLERGISHEQIIAWNLGFCPGSNDLSRKVENNIIVSETPLKLGLIKPRMSQGKYFDLFHDRIIIPIYGTDGTPVALAGRLFFKNQALQAKEMPKYINSPESDLFAKSKILFHFYGALKSIVSYGYVIVVEGYMDCISLVNAGVTNTVAVMGTALTQAHMEILTKVTKRIVLCFDSDQAGQNAAKRSFSVAFPYSGVDLEYMLLPVGKDPDEFIHKFGVERFFKLTEQRIPLLHKICEWLLVESNSQPERFLSLVKEQVLALVALHPDQSTQNEVLSFLCERYFSNMTVSSLRNEMGKKSFSVNRPLAVKESPILQEKTLEDWPVLNTHEVKFLFTLVHSKFAELPDRLRNVAQGLSSGEESDEMYCALALNHQMSAQSFAVFLEFIAIMIENPYVSLLDLEGLNSWEFSSHAKLLIAYVTSEAHVLLQFHKEELLKEGLPGNVSMISLKNIWDLKNSGFLRFQLRNVKLSAQRGGLSSFVAETLLHLELDYIDNALRAFSSFHFDNEIDKQFQDLVKERMRRRTKFSNFESFSLQ